MQGVRLPLYLLSEPIAPRSVELSIVVSCNQEGEERCHQLIATTLATTHVKSNGQLPLSYVAHSSSGLGHRPLKAEITGSNPVCATTLKLGKR